MSQPIKDDDAAPSTNPLEKAPMPYQGPENPPNSLPATNQDVEATESTPLEYTLEQDKRVLRKIDTWVLPVLCLTYILQQLCKSSLSWASAFDLRTSPPSPLLRKLYMDSLCRLILHSARDAPRRLTIQLAHFPPLHRATRVPTPLFLRLGTVPDQILGPSQPLWMYVSTPSPSTQYET